MAKGFPPLVSVDTETGKVEFMRDVPEGVDFVVCREVTVPLLVADNKLGTCSACQRPIQFRPENDAIAAPKVCMACAIGLANQQ